MRALTRFSGKLLFLLLIVNSASVNAQRKLNADSVRAQLNKPVFGSGTGYIPYRKQDKWGFADTDGTIVLKPQYDSLYYVTTGFCLAKQDSSFFLLNNRLAKVIDFTQSVNRHFYRKDGSVPYSFVQYLPLENVFSAMLLNGEKIYLSSYYGNVQVWKSLDQVGRPYTKGVAFLQTNPADLYANESQYPLRPPKTSYVNSVRTNFERSSFADSAVQTYYGNDSVGLKVYQADGRQFDTVIRRQVYIDLVAPYFVRLYYEGGYGDETQLPPTAIINLRTRKVTEIGHEAFFSQATSFDSLNYLIVYSGNDSKYRLLLSTVSIT